jgi:hypothetical protein
MAAMDIDAVWKRARADLMLATSKGEPDSFLWEHSCRVAENARLISHLPEVKTHSPHGEAVMIAGLYHDAAWAAQCRQGEVNRLEIHLAPSSPAACEQAAVLMERSLAELVEPAILELAGAAVRERMDRSSGLVEAHIVSEAENLDEFGLMSFWMAVRRGAVEGRDVQAYLDTWRRKREYQYWRARLKDAFHFEQVRELARRRLSGLEKMVDELEQQHLCLDLASLAKIGGPDWVARFAMI